MLGADFKNPWVRSVDEARRPAPAWLALILAAVLVSAALLLGPAAARVAGELAGPGLARLADGWFQAASAALFYGCVFLPLLVLPFALAALEGRRIWLAGSRPLVGLIVGLALGAGGLAVVVAIVAVLGLVRQGQEPAAPLIAATAGVVVIGFQATAEEVCFRGWLQPLLCARWGPWLGGAVTAVLFAALHAIGAELTPVAAVNLLLGGLLFGLLALRSGGLWAPVGAHFGWNWTEAAGLGLEPNPGVGPLGAMADLDIAGAALWSGGTNGLNGSLATSLVLAALIAGALVSPRLSGRPAAPGRSGRAPSGRPPASAR
ncbi:MAG TPA: CPBP family intramembrane glutamic endopeptidase [Phenylobacterium sp.]|nr:CPBP family intramembrane glutamic endopeptidase [Phenylobacterium sp.]